MCTNDGLKLTNVERAQLAGHVLLIVRDMLKLQPLHSSTASTTFYKEQQGSCCNII